MFTTIPPEVVSNHVFPFLDVNDLLRLRRMSKVSKNLAEDYLRVHQICEGVTHINIGEEGPHQMTAFLALPFTYPIHLTRLHLYNWRDPLPWDSVQMLTFLDRYGEHVTRLRIDDLVLPLEPSAVHFFEGLPNLKALRIFELHGEGCRCPQSKRDDGKAAAFPCSFKRLKYLHVEYYECESNVAPLWEFVTECSGHLEYVNVPRINAPDESNVPDDELEWVRRVVETRHRQSPGRPNLKYIDLDRYWKFTNARAFYELVTACSTHGVKLRNVNANLIEGMMGLDTPDNRDHGDKISTCAVSIHHVKPLVFRLKLPLLEKFDITTSASSMPDGDFEAQPWGNLKTLKIWLSPDQDGMEVSRLLQFFFHGTRRESLESLRLTSYPWDEHEVPYPEITDVCLSCPNVKVLSIDLWPGSDADIALLWGNLPLLEDVQFTRCENLGDAAFLGGDVTRPALLDATRLKSLRLIDMPGITDKLFEVALRHMSLKALCLHSYYPDSQVTLTALESLLTGKFAETIEKFPLNGSVELEGVTEEQLTELEGMFRSSQM